MTTYAKLIAKLISWRGEPMLEAAAAIEALEAEVETLRAQRRQEKVAVNLVVNGEPFYQQTFYLMAGDTINLDATDVLGAITKERKTFARHIAGEQPLGSNDWACARCHPNSDILVDGFVCVVHRAIDVANGAPITQPVDGNADPETAMIDAAMIEMRNITPPLRRSECQRLIRAALAATVCESCASDGKCMNRRALCTIMLNRPHVEHKKPDDTEGGAI